MGQIFHIYKINMGILSVILYTYISMKGFLVNYLTIVSLLFIGYSSQSEENEILPYSSYETWGSPYSDIISTKEFSYFKPPFDLIRASNYFDSNNTSPSKIDYVHSRIDEIIEWKSEKIHILGHMWTIKNPVNHFIVAEPFGGGCRNFSRATVTETSKSHNCRGAVNAGFFDISGGATDGACIGNVITKGKIIQKASKVNANFGITKKGEFFLGYISNSVNNELYNNLQELVTGVGWLVRDGKSFIDQSASFEGISKSFIDLYSARVGIGVDKKGNLVVVLINGKSGSWGINLYQLADLMISLDVVNAINLDGGGSVANVENHMLTSYPTDKCKAPNNRFTCERKVSTAICFKDYN